MTTPRHHEGRDAADLAFLAEATSAFASSLSIASTAETLARVAVPYLADWCTIRLIEDEQITYGARFHDDPQKARVLEELDRRYPPSDIVPPNVRRAIEHRTLEVNETVDAPHIASSAVDDEHARLIGQLGISSLITAPLLARGRVVGAITLARSDRGTRYGQKDVRLAEEFAQRASVALDNARLFRRIQDLGHRFRSLVQGAGAILFEAEIDPFRFTFVSQGVEHTLGYPASAFIDDANFWTRILLDEDREAVLAQVREAVEAGERTEFEYRVQTGQGDIVWLHETMDVEGNFARGLVSDITRQKRDEQRRAAEHAAADVLEQAASLSDAAEPLLARMSEALGTEAGELWMRDRDASVLKRVASWTALALEGTIEGASTFERGRGLPGRVWETGEPLVLSDVGEDADFVRANAAAEVGLRGAYGLPISVKGEVVGVVTLFDRSRITPDRALLDMLDSIGSRIGAFVSRTRAQRALAASESRMRGMLEAARDAIVTIDADGIVHEWNPAAETTFGFTRDEALGRPLADLIVPPAFRQLHISGLERFRLSDETAIVGERLELPAARKDGTEIFCEITITRVDLQDRTLFTGYLRDVTEATRIENEARLQRTLLESLGEASIDAIVVIDPKGQILWSNERFAELWDLSDEDLARPEGVFGRIASSLTEPDHHLARFLDLVERPEEESRSELYLTDGRVLDSFTAPIRSTEDVYHGRAWYFRDVTERRRSEEALRASERRFSLLAEASSLLAAGLDYEETLKRVARLAVPDLADACIVFVIRPDGSTEPVAAAGGGAADRSLAEWAEHFPPDPDAAFAVGKVLRTEQPELYPDVTDEFLELVTDDDQQHAFLGELGLRSIMTTPMKARGQQVGVMTFLGTRPGTRYDIDDLRIAQELAQRAAFAVDNARLFEDRAEVARTLQRSLLPPSLPPIEGLEIAARYFPAGEGTQVGGDFYDVFQTGRDSWGLVVGDVCGKGAGAAAVTALARYSLRTASVQERSPGKVLTLLNETLLSSSTADRYCTAAFARLDTRSAELKVTLACGGHPLPYLIRRDKTIDQVGKPGRALGLFEETDLPEASLVLRPGESLVLYTDGVPEGRGPTSVFGHGMLRQILNWSAGDDAEAIADRIVQTCVEFQKGRASDDIAVLVVRVPPT